MQVNTPRVIKTAIITVIIFATFIALFSNQRLKTEISHYVTPQVINHGASQDVTSSSHEFANINSKKVATIIETRPLSNLVPLVLHFSTVLGPEWPIVIFATPTVARSLSGPDISAPFTRLMKSGQIQIVSLPSNLDNGFYNSLTVSIFLTQPFIWEKLAPADHVLLFQSDSILCTKSEKKMEDYLEYDFVGAPVSPDWGEGFNGGLSLRNRNMMAEIVQQANFTKEYEVNNTMLDSDKNAPVDVLGVEDQWFHRKMVQLQATGKEVNLPTFQIAKGFVVEDQWDDRPFGYHQVERWHKDNLGPIDKWCPEWRLLREGFFFKDAEDKDQSI